MPFLPPSGSSGINYTSGNGPPTATPLKIGDVYYDLTGMIRYEATGTASSADFTSMGPFVRPEINAATVPEVQNISDVQKTEILAAMPDVSGINSFTQVTTDGQTLELIGEMQRQTNQVKTHTQELVAGTGGISAMFPSAFGTAEDGDVSFGWGNAGDPTIASGWVAKAGTATEQLNGIANSGTTYIIVGNGGRVMKSTNAGDSWTESIQSAAQDLNGVAFGASKFCAPAQNTVITSPDGTTWATQTTGLSSPNDLRCIHFAFSKFIVAGTNGAGAPAGIILTSDDGVTWTPITIPGAPPVNHVCYGASSTWIVVCDGGKIFTAQNAAVTWTERTSGTTENLYGVAHKVADDLQKQAFWTIVGANGVVLVSFDNGITWLSRSSLITNGTGKSLYAVKYGARTVALGGATNVCWSTGDDLGWTSRSVGFGASGIRDLLFANNYLFAVGDGGKVFRAATTASMPVAYFTGQYFQYNELRLSGEIRIQAPFKNVHLAAKKVIISGTCLINFEGLGAAVASPGMAGGGTSNSQGAGSSLVGEPASFKAGEIYGYGAGSANARGGAGFYLEVKELVFDTARTDWTIQTKGQGAGYTNGGGGGSLVMLWQTNATTMVPTVSTFGGVGSSTSGNDGIQKMSQIGGGFALGATGRYFQTRFGSGIDGDLVLTNGQTFPQALGQYSNITVSGAVTSPFRNLILGCSGTFTMQSGASIAALPLGSTAVASSATSGGGGGSGGKAYPYPDGRSFPVGPGGAGGSSAPSNPTPGSSKFAGNGGTGAIGGSGGGGGDSSDVGGRGGGPLGGIAGSAGGAANFSGSSGSAESHSIGDLTGRIMLYAFGGSGGGNAYGSGGGGGAGGSYYDAWHWGSDGASGSVGNPPTPASPGRGGAGGSSIYLEARNFVANGGNNISVRGGMPISGAGGGGGCAFISTANNSGAVSLSASGGNPVGSSGSGGAGGRGGDGGAGTGVIGRAGGSGGAGIACTASGGAGFSYIEMVTQ